MPDLVICFIPNEPALHAAFGADPDLFDYALGRNVLLVSPTSLIGLLRTMELGWRQERMVAEAAEIADAAGTLYTRFGKFLADFDTLGNRLNSATKAYDAAVGSVERRLLPSLRKVEGLGIGRGDASRGAAADRPQRAPDRRRRARAARGGGRSEDSVVELPRTGTD